MENLPGFGIASGGGSAQHQAMKSPQKILWMLLPLLLALSGPLQSAEPKGEWTPPSQDNKPWKHKETGLSFPASLGDYRFAGHFEYADGGVLLRYENLNEQARADVFLFKAGGAFPTLPDKQRRILAELDTVKMDMESMVKQGRYKNLVTSDFQAGELELWQKQAIPIATGVITATRIGISEQGSEEAIVRQWVGVTMLDSYLITIRYMRPARTGEAGEEAMKRLVGLIFQVIKDPSIRTHIVDLVDGYLADPFSQDGDHAAGAVLAYLKQTPYFPINIPENPVAGWLQHCKQIAPGTEEKLLKAFMLGSAKAAFADGDAETCLKEGSRQFAKVYRHLVTQYPQITRPEMEQFVSAAEKGDGAIWMKEHNYLRQ